MKDWKLVLCGGGIALAGMVVGASLFGAGGARAQTTTTWRECFGARQASADVGDDGHVATIRDANVIEIPAGTGWTPIGGGGAGPHTDYFVVFCR